MHVTYILHNIYIYIYIYIYIHTRIHTYGRVYMHVNMNDFFPGSHAHAGTGKKKPQVPRNCPKKKASYVCSDSDADVDMHRPKHAHTGLLRDNSNHAKAGTHMTQAHPWARKEI